MQDSKEENYKEMYLIMFRACEEAIDTLITAQRKCEEMYLAAGDPENQPPEEN
ncbi:MAG: hypothetical protein HFF56_00870 [Lawsonibacter sp.]|nr:hypothetical protein [Lawsonibacter sp.]